MLDKQLLSSHRPWPSRWRWAFVLGQTYLPSRSGQATPGGEPAVRRAVKRECASVEVCKAPTRLPARLPPKLCAIGKAFVAKTEFQTRDLGDLSDALREGRCRDEKQSYMITSPGGQRQPLPELKGAPCNKGGRERRTAESLGAVELGGLGV